METAYPTAVLGDTAYVGDTFPASLYWYDGMVWVDTGETGGDSEVNLTEYIKTSVMSDNFEQIL